MLKFLSMLLSKALYSSLPSSPAKNPSSTCIQHTATTLPAFDFRTKVDLENDSSSIPIFSSSFHSTKIPQTWSFSQSIGSLHYPQKFMGSHCWHSIHLWEALRRCLDVTPPALSASRIGRRSRRRRPSLPSFSLTQSVFRRRTAMGDVVGESVRYPPSSGSKWPGITRRDFGWRSLSSFPLLTLTILRGALKTMEDGTRAASAGVSLWSTWFLTQLSHSFWSLLRNAWDSASSKYRGLSSFPDAFQPQHQGLWRNLQFLLSPHKTLP